MTTKTRTPRRFRLVSVALLILSLGVGFLATTSATGTASHHASVHAVNDWLRASLSLAAGVLCLLRAALIRGQRTAWAVLALGQLGYGAGTLYYYTVIVHRVPQPANSMADIGFLALYPAMFITIILLLREQLRDFHSAMWLDALVGGLGATALAAALTITANPGVGDSDAAGSLINLAYPVADIVLLITIVSVFGLCGWRPGRRWWLLGLSVVGLVVGDIAVLVRASGGVFAPGGITDVCYPVAVVLPAFAAWKIDRPSRRSRARSSGPGLAVLALPIVLSFASFCLLVIGATVRLPLVAVVLAAATVLAALIRAVLTFGEMQQLATSRAQARTDDLTGLPNRRRFTERLEEVARGGWRRPSAVLLLDLDRFKEINNSIGHPAGDRLLAAVGERIQSALRPGDTLARLGGDEFAVLLEGTRTDDAERVARRVWAELRRPFPVSGMTVHVAASIGVAAALEAPASTGGPTGPGPRAVGGRAEGPGSGRASNDRSPTDELLRRADVAMYAAKGRRSHIELYRADDDPLTIDRLGMIEALREAGEAGQLLVYYQPKVDLRTGRCDSVEALTRWRHPTRGVIAPDVFVPLAEQAGLMNSLTLEVMRIALEQCRRWHDEGLAIRVAVNVSASNLLDANFPEHVTGMLKAHGLPPSALELEITETTIMLDWVRSAAVLGALRAIGVTIAIDDYGTGYCSLAYLHKLPVDLLKLDMSIVQEMEHDWRSAEIVRHTISLAHSLNLGLVIEGVENEAIARTLRAYGANLGQGFHLGRPAPAAELAEPLRLQGAATARADDAPGAQAACADPGPSTGQRAEQETEHETEHRAEHRAEPAPADQLRTSSGRNLRISPGKT